MKEYIYSVASNGTADYEVFATKQEAISHADNMWGHLTDRERKRVDYFEVCEIETESGAADLDDEASIGDYITEIIKDYTKTYTLHIMHSEFNLNEGFRYEATLDAYDVDYDKDTFEWTDSDTDYWNKELAECLEDKSEDTDYVWHYAIYDNYGDLVAKGEEHWVRDEVKEE